MAVERYNLPFGSSAYTTYRIKSSKDITEDFVSF